MKITESIVSPGILVVEDEDGERVAYDEQEQRELLETLARMHGFTLIDHAERKELVALIEEVEVTADRYGAGAAWRKRCEALAAAVSDALHVEQEVR